MSGRSRGYGSGELPHETVARRTRLVTRKSGADIRCFICFVPGRLRRVGRRWLMAARAVVVACVVIMTRVVVSRVVVRVLTVIVIVRTVVMPVVGVGELIM